MMYMCPMKNPIKSPSIIFVLQRIKNQKYHYFKVLVVKSSVYDPGFSKICTHTKLGPEKTGSEQ